MYNKSNNQWFKHLDFLIMDIMSLGIAFLCAFFIQSKLKTIENVRFYWHMLVVLMVIDLLVILLSESFSGVLRRSYYREFVATVKHCISVFLLAILYLYAFHVAQYYSRTIMFLTAGLYFILDYSGRSLWKIHLERMKYVDKNECSLIIVTTSDRAKEVVQSLLNNNYQQRTISGVALMDVDWIGKKICKIPVVASHDTILTYVRHEWVDEAYIDLSENPLWRDGLSRALVEMGITIHCALSELQGVDTRQKIVEKMGDHLVLTMGINMISVRQIFIKRLMDIAGGIVGCLIMGILFIFVAPMIYIQSPGPIFFKQTRVGRNGKKFQVYKFRSMYMDAEERKTELMAQNKIKDGLMFKMDFDPRIIGSEKGAGKGIGNFIRKTSIDEFPQFLNVLRGDMSLVGTRPPTVDEWEKYELHHRARLAIKPGITGLWQVSGRSKITDFEDVVRLDTKYIEEWNIGQDIKILIKTIFVVFKKDGAS